MAGSLMNHAKDSELREALDSIESEEGPRSPSPKRSKVLPDNSLPTPSGSKQQTIVSYGANGVNRNKYERRNPRGGEILNTEPIEVLHKYDF